MDQAIINRECLLKVDNILNSLKNIGLNVEEFVKIRDEIVKELDNNVKDSYNFSHPNLKIGQSAMLAQSYSSATKKLELLYSNLTKYNVYIKVSAFIKVVKNFLQKDKKEINDFNSVRTTLLGILKELQFSNTLDYNIEGPIVEDIYHVIYEFIKEEFIFLGTSETLIFLNDNYYLDSEVRKELENIDLKDKKYQSIVEAKNNTELNGLNYANEKLIKTIAISLKNENNLRNILIDLDIRIDSYIMELKVLKDKINDITFSKSNRLFSKKKLFKESSILMLNCLALTGAIVGGILIGGSKPLKDRIYCKKTEIYDPLNKDPYKIVEEETKYVITPYVEITEYTPYEEIDGKYVRKNITYKIEDEIDQNIEEYQDFDVTSLEGTVKTEEKQNLDESDLYTKTIRVIKKLSEDLSELRRENGIANYILMVSISAILEITHIIICCKCERYQYKGHIYFYLELKRIIEELKNLKYDKTLEKEYNKKLAELLEKLKTLIENNKEEINRIDNVIKELEEDEYLKDNIEFKEKINNLQDKLVLVRNLEK